MRLDTAFRLSFFVTLGLACVCLAQAELFFLWWFPAILPLLAAAFVLAWRKEGEWQISETGANYLGLIIAVGSAGWVLLQLPRSEEDLIAGGVPWPAGLLPHLGPVLLVLLLVKLFQPKKLPDFWVMQTIGLMTVTLACVLAGEAWFGSLLVVYLASLLWCLALFNLVREGRTAHGATASPMLFPRAAPPERVPWRGLGAGRVALWLVPVGAAGFALFLLLPRNGNGQWIPQQLSTGAITMRGGVETGIDLNRTGQVELSPDPAFHVSVTDAAGNPAALPGDPHWRIDILDFYLKGHWLTWAQAQEYTQPGKTVSMPLAPAAGPPPAERLHLRFAVRPIQAGGLPLAEPIDLERIGLDPSVGDSRPLLKLFHKTPGGDSVVGFIATKKAIYQYGQVLAAGQDERVPAAGHRADYGTYLLDQKVPGPVRRWTLELLARLPGLSAAERSLDENERVAPAHRARVAKVLCNHLARSGEFTYSLNLRRQDRNLDPTADFLLNVKEGHCERYAGSLALMLRAVGMPARVAKGYRGAEEQDPGKYMIRQDQAHSWVQVLMEDEIDRYWLVLDPTPSEDADSALGSLFQWVTEVDVGQLWKRFVMDYNADAQARSLEALWQALRQGRVPPVVAVPAALIGAALVFALWRGRGRLMRLLRRGPASPTPTSAAGCYGRLLKVLARRLALAPSPGQTPREFAAVAADRLAAVPATAGVADVPGCVVAALYRVRFGGATLAAGEAQALGNDVGELEKTLQAPGLEDSPRG